MNVWMGQGGLGTLSFKVSSGALPLDFSQTSFVPQLYSVVALFEP